MEVLVRKLESLNTANPETVRLLTSMFIKTELKKGWIVGGTAWQTTPTLLFISQGLLRGIVEYKGEAYTMWLKQNGFIIPDQKFLTNKQTTNEVVEVLGSTTAYVLNLYQADVLARENISFYQMLLEIHKEIILEGRERELMLRLKSAEERLNFYKSTNSSLIYKVDKNIFAPYVRMSTRHLDRFKGRK